MFEFVNFDPFIILLRVDKYNRIPIINTTQTLPMNMNYQKNYLGSENNISHKLDYPNRTEELLRPDSSDKRVREVTGDLGSNPYKNMLVQRYYI